MGKREDGENSLTEFGIYLHTLRYLKWITNKVLLDSARKCAQCYVAAWMGGEFGGEYIHTYIYILLSPFTVYLLSITTLLISYTPI